jgi:very-short-patch-repair endonuclease
MFNTFHISPTFWLISILLLIVLFVVIAFLLPKEKAGYDYIKEEYVMSEPEQKCFNVFKEIIGERYYLFPQLHLDTFLKYKSFGAFRHINEKSVDFVLCDKQTFAPVLAVELDDRSHNRPDRQNRDREVERIMKTAEMPLLRIKEDDIHDRKELLRKIEETINIYKND